MVFQIVHAPYVSSNPAHEYEHRLRLLSFGRKELSPLQGSENVADAILKIQPVHPVSKSAKFAVQPSLFPRE
jgi:hypothetical protein